MNARPGVSFGNLAIPSSPSAPAATAAPAGGLTETGKIVTGALVGAGGLVLAVLALWCCKKQRAKKQQQQGQHPTDAEAVTKAGSGSAQYGAAEDAEKGDGRQSRKDKGDDTTGVHGRCGMAGFRGREKYLQGTALLCQLFWRVQPQAAGRCAITDGRAAVCEHTQHGSDAVVAKDSCFWLLECCGSRHTGAYIVPTSPVQKTLYQNPLAV